jgi:lipoate-protein ligase A
LPEPVLRWRLLQDGVKDPFRHFAVEETLLRRVAEGRSRPTLRLRRAEPSVWIGVYQDPREDVSLEFCRAHRLPVVRRPNPGGAVYQDRGTFCYSACFLKDPAFARLGIRETRQLYRLMGGVVTHWAAGYGLLAEAAPVNDVLIGQRKVYGSAQIELGDAVAHSGTFLVDADLGVMESALCPSRLKYADRGFTQVRDRVINLSQAAGHAIPVPEAMARFVQAFRECLPVTLEPAALTPDELAEAEALWRAKYAREDWTFPRRRNFTTSLATRARSGVVRLDLELEDERITALEVRGDFLLERQDALVAFSRDALGRGIPEVLEDLSSCSLPPDLAEALAQLLTEGTRRPGDAGQEVS